jgi:hypothetical protein
MVTAVSFIELFFLLGTSLVLLFSFAIASGGWGRGVWVVEWVGHVEQKRGVEHKESNVQSSGWEFRHGCDVCGVRVGAR